MTDVVSVAAIAAIGAVVVAFVQRTHKLVNSQMDDFKKALTLIGDLNKKLSFLEGKIAGVKEEKENSQ